MSDLLTVGEIANGERGTYGEKAELCLAQLDKLPWNDEARAEYLAAAQVFASLSISTKLTSVWSGGSIADIFDAPGGPGA